MKLKFLSIFFLNKFKKSFDITFWKKCTRIYNKNFPALSNDFNSNFVNSMPSRSFCLIKWSSDLKRKLEKARFSHLQRCLEVFFFSSFCCISNNDRWWCFQTMNGIFLRKQKLLHENQDSMAFWPTVERFLRCPSRALIQKYKENLLSNDQSMETFSIHLIVFSSTARLSSSFLM